VLHAKALQGNPYDGHTLGPTMPISKSLQGLRPASTSRQVTGALTGKGLPNLKEIAGRDVVVDDERTLSAVGQPSIRGRTTEQRSARIAR
jgi:hypothetical protein